MSSITCTATAYDANKSGAEAEKSTPGRPQAGVLSWGGRDEQSRMDTGEEDDLYGNPGTRTAPGSVEDGFAVIVPSKPNGSARAVVAAGVK